MLRGPADQPAWVRPALLALLAGTAVLYLWNLSASGYANEFYAAAVQAGTQSWKAWLFGSLDSGNAITVDKPPAALWVMVASARIFGFSSWSLLAPQALMGVASVGLLYGAVRRWAGPVAGLVAGAALALTPAAVLMFRFDNPDAMLVLLLVAGAYAVVRAVDAASTKASTWWLVAAGTAVGFGFLTKMGQALLVVPAFGLVYLVAGPTRLRTRILQLLAALVAMVVSAGWFIALVELWPAADRPYIGGSTNNSLLELALGYNGIGRLFGGSGNGGGGGGNGGGNTSFGGAAGITRLFTGEIALEVSWLLPAALILLLAGLWATLRAPRTDRLRAALLLWGGWTLVTGLVLSFMSGTMHPYYTVALAPGIAALVGIGTVALWRRRSSHRVARCPCARRRGHRGLGLRAPGGLGRVVRLGALGRPRRRCPGRRRARRGLDAAGRSRRDRRGGAGRAGGHERLRRDDRGHGPQRLDPVGGDVGERDGRPGRRLRRRGPRRARRHPARRNRLDLRCTSGSTSTTELDHGVGFDRRHRNGRRGRARRRHGRDGWGDQCRADRAPHQDHLDLVGGRVVLAERGVAGAGEWHRRDVDGWLVRLGLRRHAGPVPGRRGQRRDPLLHRRRPRRRSRRR